LFVVNTAMVTLLQVRLSRGADTLPGGGRALRRAGLVLTTTCLLLATAAGLGTWAAATVLVMSIVLLSVGEMLQAAGGWGVSFALAPHERQAEYLSVFNLGLALESILGPAAVTLVVVQGTLAGWGVLAAVFCVAGVVAARLARTARLPDPVS
jgi:hypothetical protein